MKITDTAITFYEQLVRACSYDDTLRGYDYLRSVFARAIEQKIAESQIAFVGVFSKLDFCIKECGIPYTIAHLLHQARKDMFPELNRRSDADDAALKANFQHNLKATALLVHLLYDHCPIPDALQKHFPKADRKQTWGRFDDNVLRVVVERWDADYIWATEEENGTTLQICYGKDNTILSRDGKGSWDYLSQILSVGTMLNLVRIRRQEGSDIYLPELIIFEPDYLVNITTISRCFETYAESPFVCLVEKIKPQPNTKAIHLGNLAGQFLDDTVHGRTIDFDESIRTFVSRNALSMISCPELLTKDGYGDFIRSARQQRDNINRLIGIDLPASIHHFNRQAVVLEPSFFSEVLGIQGRFDFLYEDSNGTTIIEQKSGKGEFVPYGTAGYSPDIPMAKEQHTVQAILYRALYQYEFQRYASGIHMMLLYSRYAKGLLAIPPMPELFLRAIRMRNLLAWSEMKYAHEGLDILATLTPQRLNRKNTSGKLWEQYTKPELTRLLAPIHQASPLERKYYLRFMQFLHMEQLLSKVGNKQKENSGFASIWHDTLNDKLAAGNIYDRLTISDYGYDDTAVTTVTLRLPETLSSDNTNFRAGDIVILYPYREGDTPNACAQMVNRASIMDISIDSITLRLRNSQTDKQVFMMPEGTLWAIEHDLMESMTGSLYSAMHSFLSAPQSRRDLILAQRVPETSPERQIKGHYGAFDDLVMRARQANDLFLIIGPPGTGKTSFGLVNVLSEELLTPESNILLLSYTNRAVDEICSKLVEMKQHDPSFDFIRIGSDLSCAEDYRPYLLSTRSAFCASGSALSRLLRTTRVFCGTTAAINSNMSLLRLKHFSLAIVDESSQILEPHLIGLFSATSASSASGVAIDRFVLIGDHKQLPAVVQQQPEESLVNDAELNVIGITDCRLSLFERLLARFRTADGYDPRYVYMLTHQGRMHRDVAEFPNRAFYAGRLDVVPLPHQVAACPPASLWQSRLVFIAARCPEMLPSAKINTAEADIIAETVHRIYSSNSDTFSPEQTIGIIVPYRNQISTVRNAIDRYGIPVLHDITIDTVERYQGSQRDYIIYGFTVHHAHQLNFLTNNVFEEDGMTIDRKLNVAMTRARLAMIMTGNPALLSLDPTFRSLLEYVRENGVYIG